MANRAIPSTHRLLTALHTPLPKEATHLTAARRRCAPRDATALNPHCPCFAKLTFLPLRYAIRTTINADQAGENGHYANTGLNPAKDGSRGGRRAGAARLLVPRRSSSLAQAAPPWYSGSRAGVAASGVEE